MKPGKHDKCETDSYPIDLTQHERRCNICNHPDRISIEDDFLHWRSPTEISIEYNIPDRSSLYRHARAFGLATRRKRNLRYSLEYILERSEECQITGESVIRAAKLYAQLTDEGEWNEPPRRVVVSRETVVPAAPAVPAPFEPELPRATANLLPEPTDSLEIRIATPNETEMAPSD
jgi:hypothetical protein